MKKYSKFIQSSFSLWMLFVIMLSSCSSETSSDELIPEEPIPVAVVPISQTAGKTVFSVTGLFSTASESLLSFKTGGIIDRLFVKEGDFVKRGQLLGTLNLTELDAKASQAKSALEKAERDYSRAKQLYADSVATREQMENAATALDVIKQDWKTIQFNLRYSEIRSNTDGYVLMKMANQGQIVGSGTPVFRINSAGTKDWEVKAGVSDRQWAGIHPGDSATISADALPEPVTGKVLRKSEEIDPSSGTFTVYIQPDLSKSRLYASGMFAGVYIYVHASGIWSVPYEAFLDGDRKSGFVFVTNDRENVQKVKVEIGEIGKERLSVVSGLEGFKYLVLSGSPYLKDGSKIKVVKDN